MKKVLSHLTFGSQLTLMMTWMLLSSTLLLVAPLPMMEASGILEWKQNYTPHLTLALILSISYFFAKLILHFQNSLTNRSNSLKEKGKLESMVQKMDFEEKAVLREFVIQRKNVLSLPLNEPAIANLLEAGVLSPAIPTQEITGERRIVKLSISLDARPLLTHKILGLPVGKMTEEEAEMLKSARPEYARQNFIGIRS